MTKPMTVHVRTANSAKENKAIQQHLTLKKVCNDPNKCFGFAVTDGGASVYIPARLIKLYGMKPEDGFSHAGFTANVRLSDRYTADSESSQFVCEPPLKWDGQAEQIAVIAADKGFASVDELAELEQDYDHLANTADDMLADICGALEDVEGLLKAIQPMEALDALSKLQNKVTAHRAKIDELAPEAGEHL